MGNIIAHTSNVSDHLSLDPFFAKITDMDADTVSIEAFQRYRRSPAK